MGALTMSSKLSLMVKGVLGVSTTNNKLSARIKATEDASTMSIG